MVPIKPHCLMVMVDDDRRSSVFSPEIVAAVARRTVLLHDPLTATELRALPELLAKAEMLFTSWGAPRLDQTHLDAAPNLQAVFHAAGTVKPFMTEEAWSRGLVVSSASSLNAVPVAEYTLAAILFSLKQGWRYILESQRDGRIPLRRGSPGAYRSRVGLVSLGVIARQVVQLLKAHEIEISCYDPTLSTEAARQLGLRKMDLETLFTDCDVVSLHAPLLPETRGFIGGRLLARMKTGATFINTARGALVNEAELLDTLRVRPDLTAILDVTTEEPLRSGSPLLGVPNLLLTPHIAGSTGNECARMAWGMVDELDRWLSGSPLQWQVNPGRRHEMA